MALLSAASNLLMQRFGPLIGRESGSAAAFMDISFISTFGATLFALLNPLGVLPVYIGYVAKERTGAQRFVALLLSLTVLGLLLLFLTTGASVLRFFGIDLNSFRIAVGILLLFLAIGPVMVLKGKRTRWLPRWNRVTGSLIVDSLTQAYSYACFSLGISSCSSFTSVACGQAACA
jgi:hypothetical protein